MKAILVTALLLAPYFPSISSSEAARPINRQLMLRLVNEARAAGCQCGDSLYPPAAPLVWNDQLEYAAIAYATVMVSTGKVVHTGPDGSTPGDRAQRAGYRWIAYGENLAYGFDDEAAVVGAWLRSPAHCRVLMDSRFKDFGAGRDGRYWVQEYGRQ